MIWQCFSFIEDCFKIPAQRTVRNKNLYLATLLRNFQLAHDSKCYHRDVVKPSTALEHPDLLLQLKVQIRNPWAVTVHFPCPYKFFRLNETHKPPVILFTHTC